MMARDGKLALRSGSTGPVRATRYQGLSYQKQCGQWRFIDDNTGNAVGPIHGTRDDLLADLDRYAAVFGAA